MKLNHNRASNPACETWCDTNFTHRVKCRWQKDPGIQNYQPNQSHHLRFRHHLIFQCEASNEKIFISNSLASAMWPEYYDSRGLVHWQILTAIMVSPVHDLITMLVYFIPVNGKSPAGCMQLGFQYNADALEVNPNFYQVVLKLELLLRSKAMWIRHAWFITDTFVWYPVIIDLYKIISSKYFLFICVLGYWHVSTFPATERTKWCKLI